MDCNLQVKEKIEGQIALTERGCRRGTCSLETVWDNGDDSIEQMCCTRMEERCVLHSKRGLSSRVSENSILRSKRYQHITHKLDMRVGVTFHLQTVIPLMVLPQCHNAIVMVATMAPPLQTYHAMTTSSILGWHCCFSNSLKLLCHTFFSTHILRCF